jgi:hypothetical protein
VSNGQAVAGWVRCLGGRPAIWFLGGPGRLAGVVWCRLCDGSEQDPDACGYPHSMRTPERDADHARYDTCAAHALAPDAAGGDCCRKSRSGYIQWRGSLLDRALKCVSSTCSRCARPPSRPAHLRHRMPWGCLSKRSLRVPHASSREGINRSDKSIKPRVSLRFRIRRQTISSHADVVALKMWAQ